MEAVYREGVSEPRALLEGAFRAAVAAVDPDVAIRPHLPDPPSGRIVIVGAGKAAASMAAACEAHYAELGTALTGVVVTRYGHGAPTKSVRVLEASHPVPDAAGVAATDEILGAVAAAGRDDHVVVLLSGGGSALLCAPAEGVTLEAKRSVTDALLRSGATIDDMNVVRRHLSRSKGGRLARLAAPAPLTALVISDVVGDDLATIASGPTVPDPTTFADALDVLDAYGIADEAVRRVLRDGADGGREETPKPGDPLLEHCRTILVATNETALAAAAEHLRRGGYVPHTLSATIVGEARDVGALLGSVSERVWRLGEPFSAPCALLSGGETTVQVRGSGRGGRNGEAALGFALSLPAEAPVWALFADTDGIDGTEENAGAFVTPMLLRTLDRRSARAALRANDAYGVFADAGHLLLTGPTRTNVNDLRIVLVSEGAA